jgi:exodeoxyribonuclease VIII
MEILYTISGLLTLLVLGTLYAVFRPKGGTHPAEKPITHVFLDLETLGLLHNAPVLVIAAYAVDARGNLIRSRQWRVSVEDAQRHGTSDPATVQWWSEQSEAAKNAAFGAGPRLSLFDSLKGLSEFINVLGLDLITGQRTGHDLYVWGNAPTFDCAILRHAFGQTGQEVPWEFWQERDCRTVAWVGKWMGYDAKKALAFEGEPHDALDDARHQARYTIDILNEIGDRSL